MTDYKTIRGKKIKFFTSDLGNDEAEGQIYYINTSPGSVDTAGNFKTAVSSAAWSSTAPIPTATRGLTNTGSVDASVAYGGYTTENVATTLEYNGTGWTSANNMPGNFPETSKGGTQTAVISAGGVSGPPAGAATREYDGTNWTAGGNLGTGRYVLDGDGTQTAGWVCGGNINPGSGVVSQTLTEEYNGTAWSESGDLSNARNRHSTAGLQTAGLAFGGAAAVPMTISATSSSTEEYDGSSWTSGGTMGTGRYSVRGGGIQTNALAYGGNVPAITVNTELYDGTSWTEMNNLAAAVTSHGGDGLGTTKSWLAVGGATNPGNTNLSTTQEFNITVNTVTAAAWASGGNMNTARRAMSGGAGTATAGMVAGGYISSNSNATEEYNGSAWANGGNLPAALYYISIAGTQTAGLAIGGGDPVIAEGVEYNGSSWTDIGNAPESRKMMGRSGLQTAALFAGGNDGPNAASSEAFTYDGSSFTNITDLPSNRGSGHVSGGSQTASVHAAGSLGPPGYTDTTVEWNGSAWGAGGTHLFSGQSQMNSNNTSGYNNSSAGGYGTSAAPSGITGVGCSYDGTSWFSTAPLSTARQQGSGFGGVDDFVACAGTTGSATNATEEFTAETTALNLKTITDS